MKNMIFETLIAKAQDLGAFKAAVMEASKIVTDRTFRTLCENNACGMYGKCYMCPPDVGNIDELIAKIKTYEFVLVYQTVGLLEDSYDFEGMLQAQKSIQSLSQHLRTAFDSPNISKALHLCAGGCGVCTFCAKLTGQPCRFPTLATPPLEAYGIHASNLANAAGMKYVNGQNTVTYFGAVLFSTSGE